MHPLGKVETTWSSRMAYAVGLIATDGCLYNDGRHMSLTTKDRDLALTFQLCLGIHVKLGKKIGGYNGGWAYHVQFGDVLFYRWLQEMGLTPNKSKTIGPLKIPDRFFFDFLRGCFDGDGSTYSYWDPRWHSSFMFYLQFTSASPRFLRWLKVTNKRLGGVVGRVTQGNRAEQLRYAKRESVVLFQKMFHSSTVPCLHRKLVKIQKALTIDTQHNATSARVAKLAHARP